MRANFEKIDREADQAIDPHDPAFLPQRALPRVAPPPNISAQLLPFQEEGLGWMLGRERLPPGGRGGVLADEMGMGKTLQAVSLLAHDATQRAVPAPAAPDEPFAFDLTSTTLVVVPSSAVFQWKDEIERFWVAHTDDRGRALRAPKVEVYYEKRHRFDPKRLDKADVVLTTYPILECAAARFQSSEVDLAMFPLTPAGETESRRLIETSRNRRDIQLRKGTNSAPKSERSACRARYATRRCSHASSRAISSTCVALTQDGRKSR